MGGSISEPVKTKRLRPVLGDFKCFLKTALYSESCSKRSLAILCTSSIAVENSFSLSLLTRSLNEVNMSDLLSLERLL